MAKSIDLGKLMSAHSDLVRTDRMIYLCDSKVIDVFCDLNMFLDKNKEFQHTEEYKYIANDTKKAREEFINKCIIKNTR
jgi:hypothetical protein